MKNSIIATAVALVLPSLAQAGNVTVTQNHSANVYAAVQVGGRTSITVNQHGQANMAGVIQAGPRPSATIRQVGGINQAGIGQVGIPGGAGRPNAMP